MDASMVFILVLSGGAFGMLVYIEIKSRRSKTPPGESRAEQTDNQPPKGR